MGQKNIQGDVNFLGAIKQNDSPLSGGTKLYLHRVIVEMNSNQDASFAIITTNPEPLNTMIKLVSEMSYENNRYLFSYIYIQDISGATINDKMFTGLGRLYFRDKYPYYYLSGTTGSLNQYPSMGIIFSSKNSDMTMHTSTESKNVNEFTFPRGVNSITDTVTEL